MIIHYVAFLVFCLTLQQCWAKPNAPNYSNTIDGKVIFYGTQSNNKSTRDGLNDSVEEYKRGFYSQRFNAIQALSNSPPAPNQNMNIIFIPRLGYLHGQKQFKIIKNRQISAFLGLKYGYVKSGLARFQKALPFEFTENIIDATKESPNCPQFPDLGTVKEREMRSENVDDCLTLNVFTPEKPGSYPVLVFIHGEMLFDGSAMEGQPDYFLENDIVLVTINYRLAPFGYISTLTDKMPGNVALSDIQMALEWIKKYIKYLNGNPDQVTLMGQSGGATLAHALSLSGKADSLFQKMILQSGTALNPYFLDEQPLSTLRSFSRFAHCPFNQTVEEIASCFEQMSTSDILHYFKIYFETNEARGLQFANGFKLVVGDKLGYLLQHPASMVYNSSMPIIVGTTKDAGAFILRRFYDELVQLRSQNISDYINIILKHTTQPKYYTLWKKWALKHIFTSDDAGNSSISTLVQKLLELINLILYRGPIIDSIRYSYNNYSTYMYCFDYRGEYHRFGHLKNPLPFEIDATLSDDNIYLFPYPKEVSQLNPEDKAMARQIVRMWVNFATHGLPEFNKSIWPKVSSEYGPFVRFTNSSKSKIELDYHFGEGIPVPFLYTEHFNITKSTVTIVILKTTGSTKLKYLDLVKIFWMDYTEKQSHKIHITCNSFTLDPVIIIPLLTKLIIFFTLELCFFIVHTYIIVKYFYNDS